MLDMKGRLCIVTGANSGIGYHTAKGLAEMNATVVLVCRNLDKGKEALQGIKEATGNQSLYLMHCDVSSPKSIDRFTREFRDRFTCLHILINNAGAAFSQRQTTTEGIEKTLATNLLGPFKLTQNLLSMLSERPPSRIINLGSGTHRSAKMDWDDFMMERNYKGMEAYKTSKLLVTAYTFALAKRLQGTGITANIVEPGFVATNLGTNMGGFWDKLTFTLVRPIQISAMQGAETSIWAATAPELQTVTSRAFSLKMEKKAAEITHDKEFQDRLWDKIVELLKP